MSFGRAKEPPRRVRLAGFRSSRAGKIGLVALTLLALVGGFAPVIAPYEPLAQQFATLLPPSSTNLFGTDELGRDVFSRVLLGLRLSLLTALATAVLAGFVGVAMGLIAGFTGGRTDAVLMRIVDVVLAFPATLLAVVLVAVLGGGVLPLIVAIALVGVPPFARLTRASVMSIREREYVTAQRAAGASAPDIMLRTILPNAVGSAAVQLVITGATAVLVESGLSFLGLGLAPPAPALGSMLFAGNANLYFAPWYSVTVGLSIVVMVASFDAFGVGLQRQFGAPVRRGAVVA